MNTTTYRASRIDVALQEWLQGQLLTVRQRLLVVIGLFAVLFLLIIVRLTYLMVLQETEDAVIYQGRPLTVTRGEIVDRRGEILATNLMTSSLYANTNEILDATEVVQKLTTIFPDLNEKTLRKKLASGKSFVWLRRNLTPRQQNTIYNLGLPGIYFQQEEKRIYPFGALSGHLVGYTDIDLQGIAGVEQHYNEALFGQQQGKVDLSIDVRIQNVVREELQRSVEHFQAKGGSCVILDAKTGEVISMISLPDYDPNNPNAVPAENRFNKNTLGVYEMGSVFKLITIAMALESGKVKINDVFDATYDMKIGRYRIKDYRGKKRPLTVPEIFMYSSNIGTAKMVMTVGKEYQYSFFEKLGLLSPLQMEVPERGKPRVPEVWRDINAITASYGYGIALTPMHLMPVMAALVNGGVYLPPTLRKNGNRDIKGKRIVSAQTSDKIRRLMYLAVRQGTARKANAAGYVVGGKTGSANKLAEKGGYQNKNHISFVVTAFPMLSPRYIMLLTLDEPRGNKETFGYATGGWNAAPTAKNIIERIAPMLLIEPVDENANEVKTAMRLDVRTHEKERAFG